MYIQTDGDYTKRVVTPFGTTREKKVCVEPLSPFPSLFFWTKFSEIHRNSEIGQSLSGSSSLTSTQKVVDVYTAAEITTIATSALKPPSWCALENQQQRERRSSVGCSFEIYLTSWQRLKEISSVVSLSPPGILCC